MNTTNYHKMQARIKQLTRYLPQHMREEVGNEMLVALLEIEHQHGRPGNAMMLAYRAGHRIMAAAQLTVMGYQWNTDDKLRRLNDPVIKMLPHKTFGEYIARRYSKPHRLNPDFVREIQATWDNLQAFKEVAYARGYDENLDFPTFP